MTDQDIFDLVRYRLEKADEALSDALYNFENQRSLNTTVNRAYYAMFYAALALLEKHQLIPRRHRGVINLFNLEFILPGILPTMLSKDFQMVFELRQASDYKPFEKVSPEKVKNALEKANNFVTQVKDYLFSLET